MLARIWLKDVSQLLNGTSSIQRYYHGFDISPQQFPDSPGKIQFSVHDITMPFPKEHWNRYDLVHVRLLVAGLAESEYKAAITNIYDILSRSYFLSTSRGSFHVPLRIPGAYRSIEPGGYLQWEELDEETYVSKVNPVIWEIRRCFDFGLKAEGKCFQASAKVFKESNAVGFRHVVRLAYDSDWDGSLRLETEKRLAEIIQTLYAGLLLRSGQVVDEEAATKKAERLIEQHWHLCARGISPPVKLMRVVGQKPLNVAAL
ncbi:hypothetical protein ETB97_007105 [Aspergillus alliaceus]|uniref:Uncharacterized protein n=1 Tax=Petromyces alliaceus TaxID=209559 RepID=A0A8H6E366_PETAA|nr:hypothetical protein ETB97_007105 [Aspergillus burnettii]